jgi:hypothetical protein
MLVRTSGGASDAIVGDKSSGLRTQNFIYRQPFFCLLTGLYGITDLGFFIRPSLDPAICTCGLNILSDRNILKGWPVWIFAKERINFVGMLLWNAIS